MPIPVKIAGIGRYLPDRIVSNSEIETLCKLNTPVGWPPDWIEKRSGVRERRWVKGETNSFMAASAAQEAVAMAGLALTDIDLIINASGTQEQAIPDGGPLLQRELGLGESGIPSFSVHATCLSFLMALDVASQFMLSNRYQRILITTAEIASVGINFNEPESATILGDGAAAVVLTPTRDKHSAFHAAHFETYGKGAELTQIKGGGTRKHPNLAQTMPEDNLFQMSGPRLLMMLRQYGPSFLEQLRPGLSTGLGSIKLVVPHQASSLGLRILTHFGWPSKQIMVTLNTLGNCVSASIPMALYEAMQQGRLQRGDEMLLLGTGAGLSLGGIILTY